jgi:hypothetical protein
VLGPRARKGLGILLVAACFGCLFYRVGLTYQYSATLPRSPQPESGRTHPINNHGTVVYLTNRESTEMDLLFFAPFVLGPIGGILIEGPRRKIRNKP